jgi:hypothetical protein
MTASTASHLLQRLGDVRGWEDFHRDPHAHPEGR